MLQNISKELGYEENSLNKESKREFYEVSKKIFTKQNIAIYLLTILISMVGLGEDTLIAPFGIALTAACISAGMPLVMVYVSSLIGTTIKFGFNGLLIYVVASLIVLLLSIVSKPKRAYDDTNEKVKLGLRLAFSVFIVQLIYILFTGFYLYDFLTAIMISITSYIFYKIFVNSISVIKEYGIKSVFTVEEVIGASLLISIAVSAVGNFNIFGFGLRNILCIFMVLYLGYRNGMLVGATSGITIGVVLSIIGGEEQVIIAAFAIAGLIAGLLNKFGKIGVIIGFIIGNIAVAYAANGGASNIIMFQEILIASVGLLFVPKIAKINIEDVIPNTKLLPEASGTLEESSETLEKLNSISKTISDMANNFGENGKTIPDENETYEKNLNIFEDELLNSLEGLEGNNLYDDIYNNEENIIEDIFKYLQENGVMTDNGIISIFAKHNTYLTSAENDYINPKELDEIRDIIKAINTAYRISKNNFIWQKKLDENNKIVSKQLKNVSKVINNIASGIKENTDEYESERKEIEDLLKEKGIVVKEVSIKKENTGRIIVSAYTNLCDNAEGKNCPIKPIDKVLNKVFDEKFMIQEQKCGIRLNKNTCSYTFASEDKYIIQTGIAKAKKEDSIVSGDNISQIRLGDGKYMFAISDGMGSGAEARRNSKIAISMLERLFNTGFDKETSINLINSAIMNANKEEMYATLDIEILDLYAGKMQILKNGACPTYIKKNRNVNLIKSTSLPTGIVSDISVDTYDTDLADGDIVVICSDGIIESNKEYANKELWVKYLLEEIQTDSPERIADIILHEAIDNDFGKAKDDMTVIAFKVNKK